MNLINLNDPPIATLSLKRAREISGDTETSDEELQQILHHIQQFSEMVYDLYLMQQKHISLQENEDTAKIISLPAKDWQKAA